MIAVTELVYHVAERLETKLAGARVTINRVPAEEERPACQIRCRELRMTSGVATAYIRRELDLLITAYGSGEDGRERFARLMELTEAAMGLFHTYHYRIGERALTVASMTCAYQPDYAELSVTLAWSEEVDFARSAAIAENLELNPKRIGV